jgi:hypothetical protein
MHQCLQGVWLLSLWADVWAPSVGLVALGEAVCLCFWVSIYTIVYVLTLSYTSSWVPSWRLLRSHSQPHKTADQPKKCKFPTLFTVFHQKFAMIVASLGWKFSFTISFVAYVHDFSRSPGIENVWFYMIQLIQVLPLLKVQKMDGSRRCGLRLPLSFQNVLWFWNENWTHPKIDSCDDGADPTLQQQGVPRPETPEANPMIRRTTLKKK